MTPSSPGQPITSPNSLTKRTTRTMKPTKRVDKDESYMREVFGTVCLITETGRADRLLDLGHKRRVNKERFVDAPLDAWDI